MGYSTRRRRRLTSAKEINAAIGRDLRDRRIESDVTMDSLADLFGELKASISKFENSTNQISLGKYLAIMNFLREFCPDHPAHMLIAAIGPKNVAAMTDADRAIVRLAGFLDAVDLTRKANPSNPALPLADYFLYAMG